ncbi:cyclic nucleotide-gated ion channel 1 isoform X2 [Prunus yedoensis var. nudiflora]|uniref:Cyclic nucleotide-gated ion channel 1 isoform X2 n=1 Tax=Prunus yedoensis var. nudiflora TaxID=2094558 RepID=A0A314XV86_PRUYE|nr:cyclic nucleotide-gated ion channel 1 isoform X2 [Prunus yedoensis var. nudiflora]
MTEFIRVAKKIAHKMSWLSASIVVDFFALLPIPQVPMLKCMDERVLHLMCDHLKHVTYNENSFVFRKGDPLDCMLFIVEGNVWTYSTAGESEAGKATPSSMTMATKTLEKGHIYGEELLKWASDKFTELPICRQHVKSQTKVDAFVLMAKDLATVVSKYQLQWKLNNCNNPQEVKEAAASTIARHFRDKQRALMSSSTPRLRPATAVGTTTTAAAGENSPTTAINYYLRKR